MKRQNLLGLFAGALAAGLAAAPAFAEDKPDKTEKAEKKPENLLAALAKRHAAQGTIKSLAADKKSFVLTTKQGDLTVTVTAETKYHAPKQESVTFDSLKKDQHVIAQGERPNATTLAAARINLLPTKEELKERLEKRKDEVEKQRAARLVTTGVLSSVSIAADGKGAFTVTPQGGSGVNVITNADTVYTFKGIASGLASGQLARVVSVKNDAGQNVARQVHVPARA